MFRVARSGMTPTRGPRAGQPAKSSEFWLRAIKGCPTAPISTPPPMRSFSVKVKCDGVWTPAKDRRPGRDERSSEVSKFVATIHNKRNAVPACFHEVHALYLHGEPSESIPAAVSVLSLSAPCGAVVCPSELPLTRPESAFADCFPPREHLALISSPPKGPLFAHFLELFRHRATKD